MDAQRREAFLAKLKDCVDKFPEAHCKHKILPLLLQAFEYGEAGSAVLAPLFKVGLETPNFSVPRRQAFVFMMWLCLKEHTLLSSVYRAMIC